jgi:hypothetical protein
MRKFLLFAMMFVFLFAARSEAQKAQTKVISNTKAGRNILPRAAVNTKTGDVLIVWTNISANESARTVWSVLAVKQANDRFKFRSAKLISPNSGFHTNPDVIYVPWINRYMVYWDTLDITKGFTASKIMARRVVANGNPDGKVKTIINDGKANTYPRLVVHEDFIPSKKSKFVKRVFLFYSAYPVNTAQKQVGLTAFRINDNLTRNGNKVVMHKIRLIPGVASAAQITLDVDDVNQLVFMSDTKGYWNYAVGAFDIYVKPGGVTMSGPEYNDDFPCPLQWRGTLDIGFCQITTPPGGVPVYNGNRNQYRANYGSPNIGPSFFEPSSLYLTAGHTEGEVRVFGCDPRWKANTDQTQLNRYVVEGPGETPLLEDTFVPGPPIYGNAPPIPEVDIQLNGTKPALLETARHLTVYSKNGALWQQAVTERSDEELFVSKPSKLFNHGKKLFWLVVDRVPTKDTVFVVWQKNFNKSKAEVMFYVFDDN